MGSLRLVLILQKVSKKKANKFVGYPNGQNTVYIFLRTVCQCLYTGCMHSKFDLVVYPSRKFILARVV